jgi:hypothetical protein
MLENTAFSLADASAMQVIAIFGFATATMGFIVWLAWLVRE